MTNHLSRRVAAAAAALLILATLAVAAPPSGAQPPGQTLETPAQFAECARRADVIRLRQEQWARLSGYPFRGRANNYHVRYVRPLYDGFYFRHGAPVFLGGGTRVMVTCSELMDRRVGRTMHHCVAAAFHRPVSVARDRLCLSHPVGFVRVVHRQH
jgi:hypothetical protein